MKSKEQLRSVLVRRSLAASFHEAERLIMAAQVRVNGEPVTKAGVLVSPADTIEVLTSKKYVSRGGLKLEGALKDFSFDPQGLACIDAGASSGGFTDCLLKVGARSVTAVDVGYGQFDWSLRSDTRVTLFERTNIAKVEPAQIGAPFDLLVADLSFTSLARLSKQLASFVGEQGQAITLVKPQFELPKGAVKDGVVQSFDLHVQTLAAVLDAFENAGLMAQEASFSHILGPKGNIEYWIWAAKQGATATINTEEVVRLAHDTLLDEPS